MVSYIGKRGGSANLYVRLLVPPDLIETVGRREYRKSLGTPNPREAKAKAAAIIAGWQAEFEELRRRPAKVIKNAPWDHYLAGLERDEAKRRALTGKIAVLRAAGSPDDLVIADAKPAMIRVARIAHETALRRALRDGEVENTAADDFIARNKLPIAKGSEAYVELCRLLIRAELEVLQRGKERDRGEYAGQPRDPAVKPLVFRHRHLNPV